MSSRTLLRRFRARWGETRPSGAPSVPPPGERQRILDFYPGGASPTTAASSPAFEAVADVTSLDHRNRNGTALITVCTINHLHFARALVESWRRHHPGFAAYVVVVDWDGVEPLQVLGARLLPGVLVAGVHLPFMALKYSAADLCCALKPYGIDHLIRTTPVREIVYVDADIYLYAPFAQLISRLQQANFVVTPHTLAPLPQPDRFWERPSLGDLAYAGTFNAGLFGLRVNDESARFVSTWREMVTRPGAFLDSQGGQMEQNAFNWVTCFAAGVEVLRDSAYNVAYWNLHDRSFRCTALDGDGEPAWLVDGQPLVAFHFSGYSAAHPHRLSRYDQRHSLYLLPSVSRICAAYGARLRALGAGETSLYPYRFDRFPSGIRIDHRMRQIFKEHESFLAGDIDPWSPEGELAYCRALLSPIPYWSGFAPALAYRVYRERPDLIAAYPDARVNPEGLLRWTYACGVYECGYEEIFDRYRPATPNRHGVALLAALSRRSPEVLSGLSRPLGVERHRLLDRLTAAGEERVAEEVRLGHVEHYQLSTIRRVRTVLDERPDVRASFHDPLAADAERFADWLRRHGPEDHFLAEGVADEFLRRAQGRSLARIYSYVSRTWFLMDNWPLGLVGERSRDLAEHLLAVLRHGLEYDLEDVLMFLWTMDEAPWEGVPLTLELPGNARRHPSPLLPEGQERLLAPVLGRHPRFAAALERYRAAHRGAKDQRLEECARRYPTEDPLPETSVFSLIGSHTKGPSAATLACEQTGRLHAHQPTLAPGVNLFGYHKSPIGLGSLTRGLDMAMGAAGIATSRVLIGNVAMDTDLAPEHFVRRWDPDLDTNVIVSYPHLHDLLLEGLPRHMVADRRNVVYLAWEQRDGSPHWPEVFAGFDQIWALSEFAAEALRRHAGREVHAVPCVVDFSALPPPATKAEVGLPEDEFAFLYVFDANSSIERKNPEGAIRAFARAFTPGEPARLVLRASNAHRLENRERLKRMLAEVPLGMRVQVVLEPLRHRDLMRLVSAADCYMSLHRAEGFGYTCAEAMAFAKPVIATGYSGNLQFMTRDNSFLVDWAEREVEVADGPFQRGSVWAEPSIDHAAALMRRVYENREDAQRIGMRAAREVRAQLSAEAVGHLVTDLLGYRTTGQAVTAKVFAAGARAPA